MNTFLEILPEETVAEIVSYRMSERFDSLYNPLAELDYILSGIYPDMVNTYLLVNKKVRILRIVFTINIKLYKDFTRLLIWWNTISGYGRLRLFDAREIANTIISMKHLEEEFIKSCSYACNYPENIPMMNPATAELYVHYACLMKDKINIPLYNFVRVCTIDQVKKLLDNGAKVERYSYKDVSNENALIYSIQKGDRELFEVLIDKCDFKCNHSTCSSPGIPGIDPTKDCISYLAIEACLGIPPNKYFLEKIILQGGVVKKDHIKMIPQLNISRPAQLNIHDELLEILLKNISREELGNFFEGQENCLYTIRQVDMIYEKMK